MNIVEASIDELEVLQKISQETFYETFAKDNSISDTEKYLLENFSKEKLSQELANTDSKFFLCYKDSEIAGYLKVNIKSAQTEPVLPQALEIERIYILNKYHGSGMGKALMDKSFLLAKNLSIKEVWLGVWEHNVKAIKFYNKLGFNQFNQHIFKLGDDEQIDLLLKKILY